MNFLKRVLNYIFIYIFIFAIYVYTIVASILLIFDLNLFNIFTFLFSFIPFFIFLFYFRSQKTNNILKILIYNGLGVGFIGFNISNISLILSLFFEDTYSIGLISLFYILLLSIIAFLNANIIDIKRITLKSEKIIKKTKFIFLSDTHFGSNSNNHLFKIFKHISTLAYDFILIGGDLYDSSKFDLNGLKVFRQIKKPILYVSGNHEFYVSNSIKKLSIIRNYNLNLIDNKSFYFENINIIGIGDNQKVKAKKEIIRKLYSKNKFNIVLIHRPELWNILYEKIDLMLAGHTHNGQIFPFNALVRMQFKNVYGLYKKINSYLFISSGAGCWGPKMRLGSKNEIVEVVLNTNN
tara:strand:+ start:876 stop:1928 length:1053 start_codon:yes stop_codon:yes gene_type:complete